MTGEQVRAPVTIRRWAIVAHFVMSVSGVGQRLIQRSGIRLKLTVVVKILSKHLTLPENSQIKEMRMRKMIRQMATMSQLTI